MRVEYLFVFGGQVSSMKTQHEKNLVSNPDSVFKDSCEDHIKHTWKYLFPWPMVSIEGFERI